ncbi:hypothetical protein GR160_13380 [Flavobacterium sp. Sd200]|uniref:hypothetical protein n=1 Tax=Flavobacterium sp. Sd200 TaxID=2692211 RepID=UPI001367A899|nr:hypothetical protein [Flavobacterium sp. Sd200]MXN92215.1 hypothetical protein [Flavobacterium sp. Sd200]
MIKKIIAGLCLIFSVVASAQQNNASPYSFYGVGDVKFKGTVENRSMGGLSIVPDSIHLNLQNPASYSGLKFTTFSVGGTTSKTTLKTNDAKDNAGRTTFDYLAVALAFKKVGVSFGLMPYTAVGYKVKDSVQDSSDNLYRKREFLGDGGLNRVFIGGAYQITDKLSIGADFQYYFGDIETKSVVSVASGSGGTSTQYRSREINTSDYKGVGVNIGAMYQTLINKKYMWVASATYSPETTLKNTTVRNIAAITVSSSDTETVNDEVTINVSDVDVAIPSKLAVGTGFGQARKWFAGVEYTYQQNSKLSNRFANMTASGFENSHKISLGGYYTPKYMSYTSYLSRITYRAGLKYEKTGLVIAGQDINDYGVSLGLGFPLSGTIGGSNINVGAEFGKRGTTNANLVQENYVNLFIGISLNDRWFVKRRYE